MWVSYCSIGYLLSSFIFFIILSKPVSLMVDSSVLSIVNLYDDGTAGLNSDSQQTQGGINIFPDFYTTPSRISLSSWNIDISELQVALRFKNYSKLLIALLLFTSLPSLINLLLPINEEVFFIFLSLTNRLSAIISVILLSDMIQILFFKLANLSRTSTVSTFLISSYKGFLDSMSTNFKRHF